MSWDILVADLPAGAHLGELPSDFGHGGAGAFEMVNRLLEHLPWRALDMQTGEPYAPESAEASFEAWRRWRDQAIASVQSGADPGAGPR